MLIIAGHQNKVCKVLSGLKNIKIFVLFKSVSVLLCVFSEFKHGICLSPFEPWLECKSLCFPELDLTRRTNLQSGGKGPTVLPTALGQMDQVCLPPMVKVSKPCLTLICQTVPCQCIRGFSQLVKSCEPLENIRPLVLFPH